MNYFFIFRDKYINYELLTNNGLILYFTFARNLAFFQ